MEDAFLKVAQALKETEDHTKQVAVGSDLMGKSFAETLPAVRKGFDESKDSATVWSATTVQVLDTAQNNATTFVNYIKAGFGQVIADALTGTTEGFRRMKDSIDQLVDGTLKKAAGENYWQQILPPGLPKDLDDIIAKSDDWAQKTKAQGDALAEIADLGKDWNAEIKTMNPATVELAQNALAHGANQKTVADAYGLTAGAVKYLDDTMKAYQETLKAIEKIETDTRLKKEEGILGLSKIEQDASQKRFEAESRGLDQIGKAEADLRDLKEKNALDTTSYQILKIWEKADAEIAAFKGTKEQAEQHKAIVTQLAEEQVNAIQYAAETSIDHVAKHGVGKVAEAASQLETLIGGIKLPGSSEVHAFGQTYITSPTGQRIAVGPHGELPDSFWQQYSGQSSFSSGINNQPRIGSGYVPSFAEGGVGDFGSGTLAMLHGKEAIVPLGAGGAAGATTIQIYVTQPLGTPAQIADVVGRALMQNLRSQGVRVPPGA
jgi:hypothetical protein